MANIHKHDNKNFLSCSTTKYQIGMGEDKVGLDRALNLEPFLIAVSNP
jgi:hypothetical protein